MSGSGGRRRLNVPKGSPWVEIRKTSVTNFKSAGRSTANSPAAGSVPLERRGRFVVHPNPMDVAAQQPSGQCQANLPAAGVLDAIAHDVIGGPIGGQLRTDLAVPDPGRGRLAFHGRQDDGRFGLGRGFGPRVVLIRRSGRLHLTRGSRFRGQRLQAMGLDLHDLGTEAANDQRGLLPGRIGQRGETDGCWPDEFGLARGPNFQRRGSRAAKGDVPGFFVGGQSGTGLLLCRPAAGRKAAFIHARHRPAQRTLATAPAKCTTTRSIGAALEGVQAKV